MSIKLDLHVHSENFGHTFFDAKQLRAALSRRKLDGIAITNFTNLSHAKWLKKNIPDFCVIVGQEIDSLQGHIVGLNLTHRIKDRLDAQETIGQIHQQGGIAVAVHPFLKLGLGKLVRELPFDAIETYNAVIGSYFVFNRKAELFGRKIKMPAVASTDTTDLELIGESCTEILTDQPNQIFSAIKANKLILHKRSLPIPFKFIFQNFLNFRDIKPCSIHAAPCVVCAQSTAMRLFKKDLICLDCAVIKRTRLACCNGHYVCRKCLLKRLEERDELINYDTDSAILPVERTIEAFQPF